MIIGMLIAGMGIAFLAAQYSIVAGCVIAGIGALILVAITIL
jgi:hypothetical protein